ncbi:helix-turn-helix transcriptional regulator [Verrucomicrobiota bacterium sgz303538]
MQKSTEKFSPGSSEAKKARASSFPSTAIPQKHRAITRPPVERMWKIHQELKRGAFPNCVQLGKDLRFSARTIARDIEFMRSRLGMPIDYDEARKGFYYTEEGVEFPTMQITPGELVALSVARLSLERHRGTSFEAPLRTAFEKLTSSMSEEVSVRWNELDEVISFTGTGVESDLDLPVFTAVIESLFAREEIAFRYFKLEGNGTGEERSVRPLHLRCVENVWYLFAYDPQREDTRTFALSRMREARSTGKKFSDHDTFHPEEAFAQSIGIYRGRPERVRLRLSEFASKLLQERRWHASQQIYTGADASPELTMDVAITPELERSVLSWGKEVEVLEPQSLRETIREHARVVMARG